jgi:hypothetical protein
VIDTRIEPVSCFYYSFPFQLMPETPPPGVEKLIEIVRYKDNGEETTRTYIRFPRDYWKCAAHQPMSPGEDDYVEYQVYQHRAVDVMYLVRTKYLGAAKK